LFIIKKRVDLGHSPGGLSQSIPASEVLSGVVEIQIVFENSHESRRDRTDDIIHHPDVKDCLTDTMCLFQSLMDNAGFKVDVFFHVVC
jgi:hypothetical protein